MKKRVLIVEDHGIVREGLKRILADYDEFVVGGEASTGEDAVALASDDGFDVVVLDISMPGRGGMEALAQLKAIRPDLPVLVLSMHAEEQYALRCLQAGASGYIMKEKPPSELVDALRKVAGGGRYVTSSLGEKLAAHVTSGTLTHPHNKLSHREDQVMRRIAAGRALKDIAEEFDLSVKTISTYKRRIFEKMQLSNQAELIRYAMEHGLV
jgi:DNA-binding NarL/FixJ family response regulator